MMKTWIAIFLAIVFCTSLQADPALNTLMEKMQKKYDSIDTLKAAFTQSYSSRRFSDRIVEKGIVYFRKGGLMKWDYQTPERKIFLSDGTFYYYYLVEDKQVIKAVADPKNERSPTLFLAGRGNFIKDFKADWADPRPGSHLLKLTPVKQQLDFKNLIVDVDPVEGLILRLVVTDHYDNRTEYKFDGIQENPRLPDDFFVFHNPPGAEVIFQQGEAE